MQGNQNKNKELNFLKEFKKEHQVKNQYSKKYITQEEACCILDISYATFNRWMASGKHEIKKIKIGPQSFFDLSQIENLKKKKLLDDDFVKPEKACCILGVKYANFLKIVNEKRNKINKYFFCNEVRYKTKEIEEASKNIKRTF